MLLHLALYAGGLMDLKEEFLAKPLSQMEVLSGKRVTPVGDKKLVYVCKKCGYKHYVKK